MADPENFSGETGQASLEHKGELTPKKREKRGPELEANPLKEHYLEMLKKDEQLNKNTFVQEIIKDKDLFPYIKSDFTHSREEYAKKKFNGKSFDALTSQEKDKCFIEYFKENLQKYIDKLATRGRHRSHHTTANCLILESPQGKTIHRSEVMNPRSIPATLTDKTDTTQTQKDEVYIPPIPKEKADKLMTEFGTSDLSTIVEQTNNTQDQKKKEEQMKKISEIMDISLTKVKRLFDADKAEIAKVDQGAKLTKSTVAKMNDKQIMAIADAKNESERGDAIAEAYMKTIEDNPDLKEELFAFNQVCEEANNPEYAFFQEVLAQQEKIEEQYAIPLGGDISSFTYYPDGSCSYEQKPFENYENSYMVTVQNGNMTIQSSCWEQNPEAYTRYFAGIPSKEEYQNSLDDLESVRIFDDFKFPQMFLKEDRAPDRDMFVRGILGGVTQGKAKDLHRLSDDVTTIDHMLRILTGLKRSDMLFHLSRGPGEDGSDVSNRLAELGIWIHGGKPLINISRLDEITAQIKTHPEIFTSNLVPPEDWTFEKTKHFFAGGNRDKI